jgi:hypothetical protein
LILEFFLGTVSRDLEIFFLAFKNFIKSVLFEKR